MSKKLWLAMLIASGALTACGSGSSGSSGSSSSSSSSSSSNGSSSSSGAPGNNVGALIISEIVADSEIDSFLDGNDWIELKNTGSSNINLNQFSLSDSASEQFTLPNVTLQAGEYYVIAAASDDEPPATDYVPFKLGKEDSVTLHSNGEVMDSISWIKGDAKGGRSFGMFDNTTQKLYPTPGSDNVPYILFSKEQIFKVSIEMTDANWQSLLDTAQEEVWHPADLVFNGAKLSNVGFRTKGQSSLSMLANIPEGHASEHRFGFKIDMNRYQEQKFMGSKMLVLGSGFADPTMMRDVIAYQLFTDVGMPSPRASFVDLWVAGEHLGVFSLIEAIDGEFVERHFDDDQDNDLKGDLYKGEVNNQLTWSGDDISSYSSSLRLKTNEETIGTPEEGSALLRFLDTLNNSSEPLKHVDTDLMVRYFAALALTGNTDSYLGFSANNFYLYEHRSADQFVMLPWDFNLGLGTVGSVLQDPGVDTSEGFLLGIDDSIPGGFDFGSFDFGSFDFGSDAGGGGFDFGSIVSCDTVEHLIDTPKGTSADRPLIEHLLADANLLSDYHDRIRELIDGPWRKDRIRDEILRWADLLDPYVKADPSNYFTYTEWRHNLINDMPSDSNNQLGRGGEFFGPAAGLIRFIEDRVDNVRKQLDGEIPSGNSVGTACL